MEIFTVFEVNNFIKQIFKNTAVLYGVLIEGEISNFKKYGNGNFYFTLKDEKSIIKCVMFKEQASLVKFFPEDGLKVVVRGDVRVFEKFGLYQIYIIEMKKFGLGLIKQQQENLETKLQLEGLFNSVKKKKLIEIPETIGVVTAKESAALQDILNVIKRRFALVKVKVFSAAVQGLTAVKSLKKAIELASKEEIDVLIISRGGGSFEELEAFNDEELVRMVVNFKKPVVSAIGHEINRCLLDLAADVRAPTPSAAAELVCPSSIELTRRLDDFQNFMVVNFKNVVSKFSDRLEFLSRSLKFHSLQNLINNLENLINSKLNLLKLLILKIVENYEAEIEKQAKILKNLSVDVVLKKGFAIMCDEKFKIVKNVHQIKVGSNLNVCLGDGTLKVKIIEKSRKIKGEEYDGKEIF